MDMQPKELLAILQKEVVPALGCTGPTAVSYVAAEAATAVGGTPLKVEVKVDRHIGTKNSDVGIPGTSAVGLKMAAALGALVGDAAVGLNVLHNVTPQDEKKALAFSKSGAVTVEPDLETEILGLFMDCTVTTDKGIGRAVVVKTHTNLVYREANGKVQVTCAIIGAISGSGFTGVAATGPIMIPRMVEQGYPRGFATALVTVSPVLGLLIPPSAIMIIYGWITETSILACFLSTVGPGLLVMFLFCFINMLSCRKFDLTLMPPMPIREKVQVTGKRFFTAIPALLMPIIILGGIYGGAFTPTEAAAVAALYSIPVGLWVYRAMKLKDVKKMTFDSICSIGSIMIMIVFCLMLSQTFVMLKVPQALIEIIFGLTTNKTLILILMNLFLFLVGMIVNDSTGMLLCAPLLLPLVQQLGISPVQFAAIMGVNLAMGGVTPPYASILYLGMRIGKCEFSEILTPTMKLLIFGYVPVVFLTSFWPDLSLFLPRLFGYAV
ncbi:putative transporter [Oscillibacter valericigenes Sjm18-20]|nr:putative transporter [Oscillibacter valericigenes Sjm18-20]